MNPFQHAPDVKILNTLRQPQNFSPTVLQQAKEEAERRGIMGQLDVAKSTQEKALLQLRIGQRLSEGQLPEDLIQELIAGGMNPSEAQHLVRQSRIAANDKKESRGMLIAFIIFLLIYFLRLIFAFS